MNQIQLAIQLNQLAQTGPNIFLRVKPEILDFTKNDFCFNLVFSSKSHELVVEIDNLNFVDRITLIRTALFENNKLSIIGWNIKNLFTFVLAKTGVNFEFESKLLDLKLAEFFIGIRERMPVDFREVLLRMKRVVEDSSWSKFKNVYQKVYLPLLSLVLPKIEITGIFHTDKKRILFPYYEIEGQVGGRLACQLAYDNCFNPHSLSAEDRSKLQPKSSNLVFLSFDYSFHEVCVLAWLSKDDVLGKLVTEEGDFYSKLYTLLMGNGDVDRAFCKDYIFLPTIYGQSVKTLAERAKISITSAEMIIGKLKGIFEKLFTWIENYHLENGICIDYVGRKRRFLDGEDYKYRNFIIQSPGAIFCLEKLVNLHKDLQGYGSVIAHIHDGYFVYSDEKQAEAVKSICSNSLESESNLLPGLRIRTNYKISKTLA